MNRLQPEKQATLQHGVACFSGYAFCNVSYYARSSFRFRAGFHSVPSEAVGDNASVRSLDAAESGGTLHGAGDRAHVRMNFLLPTPERALSRASFGIGRASSNICPCGSYFSPLQREEEIASCPSNFMVPQHRCDLEGERYNELYHTAPLTTSLKILEGGCTTVTFRISLT